MTNVPDIDALAERLTAAMPQLDATEQRISLTLIRQLALSPPATQRGVDTQDTPSNESAASTCTGPDQ
jgi:hypothetical protein